MSNQSFKDTLHLYMISDASGETVESFAKAVVAQFEESTEIQEHLFPLVRSIETIDNILTEIKKVAPAVVLYTVLEESLKEHIEQECKKNNILSIFILDDIINRIASFAKIQVKKSYIPGKNSKLDENYYRRIEVINFTLQHDDGSDIANYNEADILILGVSRTSKSPTSLYLAQRGYKVANLPIISNIPVDLSWVNQPVIVGLTISPEMLAQIRYNRLYHYEQYQRQSKGAQEYTEIEGIRAELEYALQIFRMYKVPIIDVSRKATEEVAAEIINILYSKKGEDRAFL